MRARVRGLLGFTVMMLLAGSTTVRAAGSDAADVITVHAVEVREAAPSGPWASTPLHHSLFTAYAALQALDVVSTVTALRSGNGREVNPIVGDLAKHPAAFAATKAVATLGTLVFMHRFAKDHPRAAMITMIAFNAGYSYVVARNLQIAGR